jgi:alpha-glucosidase
MTDPKTKDADWWRGAVIYQIYPRSFLDTNSDGVGDLPGITRRLDYVASLGVDAIWISPFFRSPMKDFGYDVSDFREVDPLFGRLADFDELLAKAHRLGLKVIIDQVLNHSSDQHAWFVRSRQSRSNEKADWYVWADAAADGSPPNNWLSVFGGSAWAWDAGRGQYYLHNFLDSQPDLNVQNPAVQEQLLAEVRFWLDRGVDGFRFDAVNFYFHDLQLRNNPPWGYSARTDFSTPEANPYSGQRHLYDKTQPEAIAFLQKLRALMDRYGATTSVGEIGDDFPLKVMADYTGGGDRLHMAYTFSLLRENLSGSDIEQVVSEVWESIGKGWPCWSVGNHDAPRVVTRVGGSEPDPGLAQLLVALLCTLKGSACLYQGEELGLPEAELEFEQLRDPYGIKFWPTFKGRDGCRTPMPWRSDAPHLGFSDSQTWLPVAGTHAPLAVQNQEALADSPLNKVREFLRWRRTRPELKTGELRFLPAPQNVIAFLRSQGSATTLCVFNLSGKAQAWPSGLQGKLKPLLGHGFAGGHCQDQLIELAPWKAFFASVEVAV